MRGRHGKSWRALMALAAVVALALAACGGGGNGDAANGDEAGGTEGQELHFVADEYAFTPSSASGEAGTVTVHLENEGAIEHDFTIDGMDDIHVFADPGQAASHDYELDAGSYTFYCSVPGHRESGMEGTLEVS